MTAFGRSTDMTPLTRMSESGLVADLVPCGARSGWTG